MILLDYLGKRKLKKEYKHDDFAAHLVLTQLLHNQRVCLVGGASEWNESYSEDFDFVIRVNRNYLAQGGRVDGIYFAPGMLPVLDDAGHFIFFSALNKNDEQEWLAYCNYKHTMPFRYFPECYEFQSAHGGLHEWPSSLMKELGTQPLTGIFAVKHLLSLPISELHITGFNFYSQNGVIPHTRDSHKLYPQIEWLKNQIRIDGRITYDLGLEKIINHECKYQNVQTFTGNGHTFERVIG